jgi:hypothetical protein
LGKASGAHPGRKEEVTKEKRKRRKKPLFERLWRLHHVSSQCTPNRTTG